jgi:cation diffusion facilitator CzcD-associated flavoprotein CzcO
LTPKLSCRRATPGLNYLEALTSPKVEVVWGEIAGLTQNGVQSASGAVKEVDTVICATGFDMGFAPRFPLRGANGVDLRAQWATADPVCYLSLAAEDMPNYFVFMGPASPLGHGSIVGAIEQVTKYISKMVEKLQTENYKSVMLKPGKSIWAFAQHSLIGG